MPAPAVRKATKWASPSDPNGTPPSAIAASATSRASVASSSPYAASPSSATRRVDPSMSVNRKVTVPVGRGGGLADGSAAVTAAVASGAVVRRHVAEPRRDYPEHREGDAGL